MQAPNDVVSLVLTFDEDVVRLRKLLRDCMVSYGFTLIEQTKMITATSELARNALRYADGGTASIEILRESDRLGVSVTLCDDGPGIEDVTLALTDGYTTGGGLGLGLGGAKRLADEFNIHTELEKGTTVNIVKWK